MPDAVNNVQYNSVYNNSSKTAVSNNKDKSSEDSDNIFNVTYDEENGLNVEFDTWSFLGLCTEAMIDDMLYGDSKEEIKEEPPKKDDRSLAESFYEDVIVKSIADATGDYIEEQANDFLDNLNSASPSYSKKSTVSGKNLKNIFASRKN